MKNYENLQIRPFHPTDHDYHALIQMNRFRNPDEQLTLDLVRLEDAEFHEAFTAVRVLGEIDGQVVAQGSHYYEPGSKKIQFAFYVVPAWQETAVPAQIHRYLLDEIAQLHPEKIVSEPPENETFRTKLLEADGFRLLMRFPRSALDVRQVQLADYANMLATVQQQGIRKPGHRSRVVPQGLHEPPPLRHQRSDQRRLVHTLQRNPLLAGQHQAGEIDLVGVLPACPDQRRQHQTQPSPSVRVERLEEWREAALRPTRPPTNAGAQPNRRRPTAHRAAAAIRRSDQPDLQGPRRSTAAAIGR